MGARRVGVGAHEQRLHQVADGLGLVAGRQPGDLRDVEHGGVDGLLLHVGVEHHVVYLDEALVGGLGAAALAAVEGEPDVAGAVRGGEREVDGLVLAHRIGDARAPDLDDVVVGYVKAHAVGRPPDQRRPHVVLEVPAGHAGDAAPSMERAAAARRAQVRGAVVGHGADDAGAVVGHLHVVAHADRDAPVVVEAEAVRGPLVREPDAGVGVGVGEAHIAAALGDLKGAGALDLDAGDLAGVAPAGVVHDVAGVQAGGQPGVGVLDHDGGAVAQLRVLAAHVERVGHLRGQKPAPASPWLVDSHHRPSAMSRLSRPSIRTESPPSYRVVKGTSGRPACPRRPATPARCQRQPRRPSGGPCSAA